MVGNRIWYGIDFQKFISPLPVSATFQIFSTSNVDIIKILICILWYDIIQLNTPFQKKKKKLNTLRRESQHQLFPQGTQSFGTVYLEVKTRAHYTPRVHHVSNMYLLPLLFAHENVLFFFLAILIPQIILLPFNV